MPFQTKKAIMRIAITGASGFVGHSLVPLLHDAGAKIVVIGRDTGKLRVAFPMSTCCSYDQMAENVRGFDVVLHLAVANNNLSGPYAEFHAINVQFLSRILEICKAGNVRRLVNFSSTHAMNKGDDSHYAKSKREALDLLRGTTGIQITNLFLPIVYGNRWSGTLAFLNSLPSGLARPAFKILAALKPTVNVAKIADEVLKPDGPPATSLILSDRQSANGVFAFVKRSTDLAFAFAVILFFGWLMLLVWIAVRLGSAGPGLFAQDRVGQHAAVFTCYKFRTMQVGTVQAGTHETPTHAVTKLGRFLRKTKLDELPQVWNILRNEMSVVGPRPCLPVQTELIEERKRLDVLDVKPGITGLAQINDIDMSDPVRLAEWDSRYIKLQSLLTDFKILVLTLTGSGTGDRIVKTAI